VVIDMPTAGLDGIAVIGAIAVNVGIGPRGVTIANAVKDAVVAVVTVTVVQNVGAIRIGASVPQNAVTILAVRAKAIAARDVAVKVVALKAVVATEIAAATATTATGAIPTEPKAIAWRPGNRMPVGWAAANPTSGMTSGIA
jgi:hypothetical protein